MPGCRPAKKKIGARPPTDLEFRDAAISLGVNDEDLATCLAGHVKVAAIRRQLHSFGLLFDAYDVFDLARSNIQDADRRDVLVGNVELSAVEADREFLGVGAGRQLAHELPGVQIDHGDTVLPAVAFIVILLEDRVALGVEFGRAAIGVPPSAT